MIENRAGPTNGRMTGVAFQVGIDVLRSLALRLHIVVAGGATAAGFSVVEVDGGIPRHRGMTAVASVGRQDMRGCLGGSPNCGADAVTRGAVARCSFEYRIGMTQLALQIAMLSHQLESGSEVIEAIAQFLGRAGCCCQQGDDQQQAWQHRAIHGGASAQTRALETVGRMAALALPAILSEMDVVLLVTGQARRIEFDLVRGLFVAARAGQPRMPAGQCKSGLLAVVEIPLAPAIG